MTFQDDVRKSELRVFMLIRREKGEFAACRAYATSKTLRCVFKNTMLKVRQTQRRGTCISRAGISRQDRRWRLENLAQECGKITDREMGERIWKSQQGRIR